MQIFLLIFIRGLRGPYGKGLVGHCTSGDSLSPPLRSGRTVGLQLAVMMTTYVNTEIVIAGPCACSRDTDQYSAQATVHRPAVDQTVLPSRQVGCTVHVQVDYNVYCSS